MSRIISNLNISEIKKYISIRYPFLMIDGAYEIIPGVSSKGYKNVTVNESYFQGHFPNDPLMPGMIQMEALLQMLSLTVLTLDENKGKIVRGTGANKIILKNRVVPGSRLDIETELVQWNGMEGIGIAKGFVNGTDACSAEFNLEIFD